MYFADIKSVKETDEGTDLTIHVPNEFIQSKIIRYRTHVAEVSINDGRTITPEQRKKIYATLKDISLYTGDEPEYLKEFLKFDYCGESGEDYFSLSDCSVETARKFINHLIEFVIKSGIPLTDLAVNRTDDIDKYLYYCLKHRVCAISGKPNADIHHCEGSRVGIGSNRREISNKGRELIALSREWHTRVHNEGEERIFKLYKVYGITLDDITLKELNLSDKDIS